MTPDIGLGSIIKRTIGGTSVEIRSAVELRSAESGWLVFVAGPNRPGPDSMFFTPAEADALVMLLLTATYKVSEADVEIALTTLASLEEGA